MKKNELAHHGVIGMKWGVRRYQNYDGTYTRKGMQHYRKAQSEYDDAKQVYKSTKQAQKSGTASKSDVKNSRQNLQTAKKNLDKNYDHLRKDYRADQGKELYRSGHTITSNNEKANATALAAVGAAYVAKLLSKSGNKTEAEISAAVAIGLGVTSRLLAIKTATDNSKLRAYYSHSSHYAT